MSEFCALLDSLSSKGLTVHLFFMPVAEGSVADGPYRANVFGLGPEGQVKENNLLISNVSWAATLGDLATISDEDLVYLLE